MDICLFSRGEMVKHTDFLFCFNRKVSRSLSLLTQFSLNSFIHCFPPSFLALVEFTCMFRLNHMLTFTLAHIDCVLTVVTNYKLFKKLLFFFFFSLWRENFIAVWCFSAVLCLTLIYVYVYLQARACDGQRKLKLKPTIKQGKYLV